MTKDELIKKELVTRELSKRRLYNYMEYMFERYYKTKMKKSWFIEYLCEVLTAVYNGEINRLIINMPPSYGKTEIVFKSFVSWVLGQDSSKRFIHTSYSAELSNKNSYQTRQMITSRAYCDLFDVKISKDQNQKSYWETSTQGGVFATGTGGAVTGFHSDYIIIDDPLKAIDSNSKAMQNEVIEYYTGSLVSRLRDKKHGAIIIIMQRLNPYDLVGYLEGNQSHLWHKVCLTGIEKEQKIYEIGDYKYIRKPFEPLFEEHEDREILDRTKKEMGLLKWNSQYMQSPEIVDGGVYRDEHFSYISTIDIPKQNMYIAIDPAQSIKEDADNRAIMVVGISKDKDQKELYVVYDVLFGIWRLDEFVSNILETMAKFNNAKVLIESSGGGILVNQELKKQIPIYNQKLKAKNLPILTNYIKEFSPKRSISKNQKIQALEPYFFNHQIKFLVNLKGVEQLKKELKSFMPDRDSKQDDCMDCLATVVTSDFTSAKKEKSKKKNQKKSISIGWRF
jgi:hypothetical protein